MCLLFFFLLGSYYCMLYLAVPPIMLHNLSLRAILYDAVLHLGNKFDLKWVTCNPLRGRMVKGQGHQVT